jgi:hypothetical protein
VSTKTTTDSTNTLTYDAASKGVYNSLQPQIGSMLSSWMGDPLKASGFLQNVAMGQKQISTSQAGQTQNMMQNAKMQGFNGAYMPAFMQSSMAKQGRATSAMQSQNFMGNLSQSRMLGLQATGMAQGYNPLMTGSTGQSTTTKSGLGTWLPQVLGAGLSMATGLGGAGSLASMFQPSDINQAPTGSSGMLGTVPGQYNQVGSLNPLMLQGWGNQMPTGGF